MITSPIIYSQGELKFSRVIELLEHPVGDLWKTERWGAGNKKRSKRFESLKLRIKTHYRDEQKQTCPYCSVVYPSGHNRAWDTDHIIPKSENANFLLEPKNLCATCIKCNECKRDQSVTKKTWAGKTQYPTQSEDFIIVHPHFDNFDEHIEITGYVYSPKNNSEKGAETIRICNLLRFATMNLPLPPLHNILDTRAEELLRKVKEKPNGTSDLTAFLEEYLKNN